ncbi:hydantoinase/oxoprolinase family protein [Paracoccus denitrificans]|jgi:N-methylhydantoinase A|uniref:5-oxoprolinase (ATP-hydrolyzing) n=1 Tax=Paracoccus denitrificans (strain Pd 1222) TaxID=318586 RepID=A1BA73_PARDP|nr:hydantoinase/oxoprolinase family protein [Paracoccus denitrificans]ABL72417.1 5-oxoprolinase (ATP-hydrolyzing) [Paracoccus denitrificans PD1222]MBB4628548.1 N-methylhydantoinase A [Paracoccus denitrificans]MCU7430559.1 hydantoinase/oxoprolinase family protein [Paracoccus denitrificans]QAR28972.1 hydantoinase/oxoprolinase family protein [Paracoccus denitrificans]UPV97127.1 hydantoinase/oxoprolinase family protein [Paracoccus denitrificans]
MARIGVDVGGTNTDLVLECGQGVFYHKVPTTLKNQSIGVVEGVRGICRKAGIDPAEVEMIVHGTTTATNITIEHNGSECGMITTHGFRDILHIGRHKRPCNFSLHFDVPWQSQPLVKRRNRIAVRERILPPTGEIAEPLDEQAVRDACALFRKRGIGSVVIGFMFAFLNDAHERRAKEIVLEEMPDAYVTLSSEVANVMREYERFSTAAMNSYVGPKTARYLRDLDARLREAGVTSKLRIMQSNGGVSTVDACARRPIRILMSGPAGGVIGGASEGEMAGTPNIITVDIGGTSADVSTIPGGAVKIMNPRDTYVSGHPVLTPMIDLVTIGAGGGSVAHIDEAGAFHVGPRSAGSEPGPACYGRGGTEPTVTDAQIVLGRLDPDMALGGDLKLDPALSFKAVEERIARPLGMSVKDAALGIIRIVNNNMALAIRSNSVARGIDPREFSIMPFGGAGPLHGVALAEAMSARDVIVPVAPGITAAVGLLKTDLQYEHTEAVIVELMKAGPAEFQRINTAVANLRAAVQAELDGDGIPRAQQEITVLAECRYHGQGFELRATMPEGPVGAENRHVITDSFHDQHQQDYGYSYRDAEVELITLRAIGSASVPRIEIPKIAPTDGSSIDRALMFVRPTTFDDGRTLETPRYDRGRLMAGDQVPGPAILHQHNATTLVPPGYVAETLDYGNTRIRPIGA